jgi:hypothetical protein
VNKLEVVALQTDVNIRRSCYADSVHAGYASRAQFVDARSIDNAL